MRAIGMSFFLCAVVIVVPPLNAAAGVPDFFEELPRLLTSVTNSTNFNPLLSRVARQTPPSVPCCGEEKLDLTPITDEYEDCKYEIGDLDKNEAIMCSYECAGKKLRLCDDEGYIKKEEFLEFSRSFVLTDDRLGEFVKSVAEMVIDVTTTIPKNKRKTKCNIDMMIVCSSLFPNVENMCPEEMQNKVQECEELRAYLKKLQERDRR